MTTRKRGGQPGNTNALKHGFYSSRFTPEDLEDLDSCDLTDLDDEIKTLRVVVRKCLDLAHSQETQSLDLWLSSLDAIGSAYIRIASLARTQAALVRREDTVASAITQAIKEVTNEFIDHQPRIDSAGA